MVHFLVIARPIGKLTQSINGLKIVDIFSIDTDKRVSVRQATKYYLDTHKNSEIRDLRLVDGVVGCHLECVESTGWTF